MFGSRVEVIVVVGADALDVFVTWMAKTGFHRNANIRVALSARAGAIMLAA